MEDMFEKKKMDLEHIRCVTELQKLIGKFVSPNIT
jgi:hypothetical protein